jgi:hypothetical protein
LLNAHDLFEFARQVDRKPRQKPLNPLIQKKPITRPTIRSGEGVIAANPRMNEAQHR